MTFKLSKRSLNNLVGVHPDLVLVTLRALELSPVDFSVIDGVRTIEEQKRLYDSGASQTMKSRHLTGHAVDLVAWADGKMNWKAGLFFKINAAFSIAAQEHKIMLEWGGDWETFKDYGHWQLSKKAYP